MNAEKELLTPLERPLKEAIKLYLKRFIVLLKVTALSFVTLSLVSLIVYSNTITIMIIKLVIVLTVVIVLYNLFFKSMSIQYTSKPFGNEDKQMSETGHLLHAAKELAEALNKAADENLPNELAGIVKTHSTIAVGSAFIPVPGADVAAAATNIWTMYVRINNGLDLPFADNILKSVAAGVVTNLAGAAAGFLVVGSALKFIPGLGTIGGAAIMGTTIYAITIASGIVYMKAVTALLNSKKTGDFTEADLKSATDKVMNDKDAIKDILKEGKAEYKNRNDSDDRK